MFEVKKINIWDWVKTNAFYTGLMGVLISIPYFFAIISRLTLGRYFYQEVLLALWILLGSIIGWLILGALFAFLYNLMAGYYSGLKMDLVKNQNDYYEIQKVQPLKLGLVFLLYFIVPTLIGLIWFYYAMHGAMSYRYDRADDSNSYYWLLLIALILAIVFYLAAGILLAWFYNWLASHKRGFKIKVEFLADSGSYVLKKFRIIDFSLLNAFLSPIIYLVGLVFWLVFMFICYVVIEGYWGAGYYGGILWTNFWSHGFKNFLIAALFMVGAVFVVMFIYGVIFSTFYNWLSRYTKFIRFWLAISK